LRAAHFKRIGKASAHFDDYIGNLYGLEDQDAYAVLAAREEVRKDVVPLTTFMEPIPARRKKARSDLETKYVSDYSMDQKATRSRMVARMRRTRRLVFGGRGQQELGRSG